MTGIALAMILVAAFFHACWNYLAKKSPSKMIFIYTIHLRSFSLECFLEPFAAAKSSASLWALLTGVTIAAYSLVDKVGVGLVHPPVYIYLMLMISWLMVSPLVLTRYRNTLLITSGVVCIGLASE